MEKQNPDFELTEERIQRAYQQITQGGMTVERISEGVPEGVVIFRVSDSLKTATLYTPYLPQQVIYGFAALEDAIAHAQGHTPQQSGRPLLIPPKNT